MNPKTEDLSAHESLSIITAMIQDAKGKVQRNSFFFLLWGWVVAIANLGLYVLIQAGIEKPYYIWSITIPAWILTLWKVRQLKGQRQAKSHFDTITTWLWMSFGLVVFTLVVFGSRINYQLSPVILIVSALPTLVSGIIVRFRPLIYGAVAFWISGIISFLVSFETQPLIGGLAIICGYLIPGYMLRNKSE